MKIFERSRECLAAVTAIVAAVLVMVGLVAVPNSWIAPDAEAAGPTSPASGAFSVTSTMSPSTLPVGGGTVTMTYTVRNLSTEGNRYLFYASDANSVCSSLTATGFVKGTYDDYIVPGGTATFTCTANIRDTTDVKQTFEFYSWDAYYRTGTGNETIQLTDRVTVTPPPTALGTCDTVWTSSFDAPGSVGAVNPATGVLENRWPINFVTSRAVQERNYAGQLLYWAYNYTTGAYYKTTTNTGSPVWIGSNFAVTGSSGFAIDPTNPQYAYFGGRNGDAFNDELYRMDLLTGTITSLGSHPAFSTNRLAVDSNGTLWSFANDGVLYSVANVNEMQMDKPLDQAGTRLSSAVVVPRGIPVYFDPTTRTQLNFASLQSGDIAFDGNGTMYVLAAPPNNTGAQVNTKLLTIDPTELTKSSGIVAKFVGDMGYPTVGNFFNGLAFDTNGTLYASSTNVDKDVSALYTIDMATGKPTLFRTSNTAGTTWGDLASCALPTPRLVVTKTANPNPVTENGIVTYTVQVRNIGTISASGATFKDLIPAGTTYVPGSTTLNGARLSDVNGTGPFVNAREVHGTSTATAGLIPKGDTATVTFQVKVATGQTRVCNQGDVNFTTLGGAILTDDPDLSGATDATCVDVLKPSVEIVKRINGDDSNSPVGIPVAAGTKMDITFEVTNTGNAPLIDLEVTDNRVDTKSIVCDGSTNNVIKTLGPGRSTNCSAEVDAPAPGQTHVNTGTVSAVPSVPGLPAQPPVQDTDDAYAFTPNAPSIDITKFINDDPADQAPGVAVPLGQLMNIKYAVVNTGTTVLNNVKVTDDKVQNILCPKTTLAPAEEMTCTAAIMAPQPGVQHKNTATVVGKPTPNPDGSQPADVTASNSAFAYVPVTAQIDLVKKIQGEDVNASPGVIVEPGQPLDVTFEVTNTSNVQLTNVKVTDDKVTNVSCPKNVLAVGEKMVCTATVPALQPGENHMNTATVTGTPPANLDGTPAVPVTAKDVEYARAKAAPAFTLVKKINGDDANAIPGVIVPAGQPMNVTFEVTNTGNLPLVDISVTDDKATNVSCPADTLAVGANMTCTATIPAPEANTQHTNTGTLTVTPLLPDGTKLLSPQTTTDIANAFVSAAPDVKVVKKINGEDANTAPGVIVPEGSELKYTFEVTNTGNVSLTDILVTDDKISGINCPVTELAAGATTTCTATGPAPAPGEQHTNTATVTGNPPTLIDGNVPPQITATDQANALVEAKPSLKLVKKINGEDANEAPGVQVGEGSTMLVSFEVTNTGNVTLSGGKLVDDVYGEITCPTDTLAPGYTTTCVIEKPAPAVGEQHTNTATATGQPPANPDGTPAKPVSASDEAFAVAVAKPVPSIEIIKKGNGFDADVSPGIAIEEGSQIDITFRVSNTGNTELTDVSVSDDKLGAVTCPKTTLPVGESMECTAKQVAAPRPGEVHSNLATVTATSPEGVTVTNDDPFNAYVENAPGIQLVKKINGEDANDAPGVSVPQDSTMKIEFEVTNTGNTELTEVTVGDNMVQDISCPATSLAAGASMTCTAELSAPAPGELHTNVANVFADTPPNVDGTPGDPVFASDTANAIVPAQPGIKVDKKINGEDGNNAPVQLADGEPMIFTFDVTNTGNVPLDQVVVADDKISDISCPKVELAPGESMQCTASAAAPEAGQLHNNTVTVSGQPPQNTDGSTPPPVTGEDSATAIVPASPAMKVTKFLNGHDANDKPGITVAEGSTMAVSVHVQNTGNMPLMIVSVTDSQVAELSCPKTELPVGEDMWCLGSLPAPKSGEQHTNIAKGTAAVKNPDGTPGTPVADEDPANAIGTDAPAPVIEVIKKINGDDANSFPGVSVGEDSTMQVTFEVTNKGNTALRNVVVTDDQIANISCPESELAAGETMTCSALMAAPALGTQHQNLATVTATEVKADGTDGVTVQDTNPAFAVSDPKPAPSVSIVKRINGDDANDKPGVQVPANSTLNITFEIRNTGNTVLTDLRITDVNQELGDVIITPTLKMQADGTLVAYDGTLAPGEWTSADAPFPGPAAGQQHSDDATVVGNYTAPDGTVTEVKDSDPAHAFASGTPALTVEKKINGNDAETAPGLKVEADSTMDISILVTNTGDVNLSDVTVTDDKIASISCPANTLAVGENMTCTGTMPAPAAGEQHMNTATVTAQPPANLDGSVPELPAVTDTAYAYSGTFADITIEKKINGDDADIAPGVVVTAGSTMNIEFVVTNSGSVKLSDVKVTDSKILDGISCPKNELAAGESMTCTASHPAPVSNGMTHDDVATAEGTPPVNLDGTVPPSPKASDAAYAQTPGVSGIQVVKKINGDDANEAPGVLVTPGTPLDITFEVTNTGSVDLSDVKVTDDKIAASDITCPQTTLKAGESMTCSATVPALQNLQTHDNVATVTGTPPKNPDGTVAVPPTATDEAHAHTPGVAGIAVEKRINGDDADAAPGVAMQLGETMYLTYEVTNTGSTVLDDVKVTDDKVSDINCPKVTLNPGESMTCTAELTAPAGTGQTHVNVATATGMPPQNPDGTQPTPPTATDEAHAYTPGLASVEIIKRLNGDDAEALPGVSIDALAPMNFTFDVTNTGQVKLTDVQVTDDKISDVTCPKTELAPGEGMQCTGLLYAPTEGEHTNTATVTGTPNGTDDKPGTPVTDTDVANATIIPLLKPGTPGVSIVKKINDFDANEAPGMLVKEGEQMAITFEVANNGTAPLIDVTVTDDKIQDVNCPQTTLAVGESMTCTASYPAPKTGEQHTNTATVTATGVDAKGVPLDGGPVTATDVAHALDPVTPGHPGMGIVKKINGQDANTAPGVAVEPGTDMELTFEVSNFGDVEIKDIAVSDDMLGVINCPSTSLLAGESMTCTATAPAPAVGEQHTNTATVSGIPVPNPGELPGPPVTATDQANAFTPGIEVVKKINDDDANEAPGVEVEAKSTMNLTFEVTNRSRAVLQDITLTDSVIKENLACPKTELLPGETMVCETTLAAPAAGQTHSNTATVTGVTPANPDGSAGVKVTDDDPAFATAKEDVVVPGTPGLAIVKKINGADANSAPGILLKAGDTMDITFEVVNNGTAPLIDVKVTDDQIASVSCPQTTLAVGESMTCTASAAAPAPGVQHTNTGTVTGTAVDGTGKPIPDGTVTSSDPANAFVPVTPGNPQVMVVKKINGQDAELAPGVAVKPGEQMQVTFEVSNLGDAALTGVMVTDDKISAITCPKDVLAAGENMTCTGAMAAPAVGEQHTNTATVVGTPVPNPGETPQPPVTDTDKGNAYVPGIEVVKKINGDDANTAPGVTVEAGSQMDVTFEVSNTGLATLSDIVLTDSVIPGERSCPKMELLPGESMTCATKLAAPAVGEAHENTAKVVAKVPANADGTGGGTVEDTDPAFANAHDIERTPGVAILKKINGDDANELPGVTVRESETMNITIEVVNNGNALLRDVKVSDDKIANISCGQTELHVGETMLCTGTMPTPKAGESHTNTATVTAEGVDLAGKPVGFVEDNDSANATSMSKTGHPAISVVKKINGQDASNAPGVAVAPGSTMEITFEVTNTGDVELTGVTVTDDKATGITCPVDKLQPGESTTCTASAPAPAVGEQHTDVVKAVGTPTPNTGETPLPPVEGQDNANAYVPAIEVVKKINGEDANDAPVTVPADIPMLVTFEVTNKGLAALNNVKVTDDVIATGISCPKDALLPGETMVCTATGDAPAEGTEHKNTATVTAEVPPNPDESTVPPVKDEDIARAVVTPKPAPGTPGVTVVKKINGDDANDAPGVLTPEGTMMDITFEVTNTGETRLIDVSVLDDQATVSCPQTDLAIGETMVCTAQLPAPMAGQEHKNTATVTATGEDRDGAQLGGVSDTDSANAYTPDQPERPGIVIVKKINDQDASVAPGVAVADGSVMDVTFEVTNTGDVELTNVAVSDDKIAGISCPSSTLQPGETMTCTASDFAPAVGEQHTNVAKVTADPIDPLLPPVDDEDNANAYVPGIKVIKKINGEDADTTPVTVPRGVDMLVTFEVANTGLAALHDVRLTDDVIATGITCSQDALLPGESMLCYATLPAPADGVTHINTATVTGEVPTNPDGSSFQGVQDTNPAQAVVAPKPEPGEPAVTIVKKLNGEDANAAPGARVDAESDMSVTFEVTNTGQTLLKDVSVTDDKLSSVTCPKAEIHVGETIVCTGTLKAPAAGKNHTNTGSVKARGYDLEGLPLDEVEATDPAHAYALPKEGHPSVVIVKKINGQDASLKPGVSVADGADMTVTFEVTNNGDVDLTDVKVTDDKIGSISCPMTELKVGESMTCTATAKAPAAGEQHENVAKVVGTPKPNEGEPQQPPVGDDDNAFAYVPAIEVVKMINGDDANDAPGAKVKPGTTMEVTFKVVNKGLGALNDIKLSDDKIATDKITCPKYDLLPGEEMTCRATIDTPADGAQHVNTATVVGQPPALADGTPVKPVEDTDVAHARGTVDPTPGSSIPKIPWWIIPAAPIIGGLLSSIDGSSGSSEPGQPSQPAQPGQSVPSDQTEMLNKQPQKDIPGKGGLLAQTGVQLFGLAVGIGVLALALGLAFLAWSKRRQQ